MEDAVNVSTAAGSGPIVVAGAGYAGLHVALRLTAKLRARSTGTCACSTTRRSTSLATSPR